MAVQRHRHGFHQHIPYRAGLLAHLHVAHGLALGLQGFDHRRALRRVHPQPQLERCAPQRFAAGVAGGCLPGAVHIHQLVGIQAGDGNRRRVGVEDRLEARLAVLQRLLGPPAGGHIAADPAQRINLAFPVAHRKLDRKIGVHPVRLQVVFLYRQRLAGQQRLAVVFEVLPRRGLIQQEILAAFAVDLLGRLTKHCCQLLVDQHKAPVQIGHIHQRGSPIDDLLQPRFGFTQRLLGLPAFGDIAGNALDGHQFAGRAVDVHIALLGPDHLAVFAHPAQGQRYSRLAFTLRRRL